MSCGSAEYDPEYRKPPPKVSSTGNFNYYHQGFPAKVTVAIMFGETGHSDALGTCFKYKNGYRYIAISKGYWAFLNEAQRTQLIWHELGHCQLGLMHNTSNVPTLMRAYGWYKWEFKWHEGTTRITKQMLLSRDGMYD
jgi:hypothetical protein